MTKAIAFFPWVKTREPITIGSIRLIPWEKGKSPANLENATLHDIDNVLSAYANRPKQQIKTATLLEYENWQTGTNVENYIDDLFFIRQLIGFSALSQRRLFNQGFNYCNFDNYLLIIQEYQENCGRKFTFTTRRRGDGGCRHCWSSDEFAFHRPYHVDHQQQIDIDQELLFTLARRDEIPDHFYFAIKDFNLANTDSPDVQEHIEMVMMKSAFESLFKINQQNDKFINGLKDILIDFTAKETQNTELARLWMEKRPKSDSLISCWAAEFCDLRGFAAHGNNKRTGRFVWTEFWHLAFASILFPLLVKASLAKLGYLEMKEIDKEHLKFIEHYLAINPNPKDSAEIGMNHPWLEIEEKVQNSLLTKDLHEAFGKILDL